MFMRIHLNIMIMMRLLFTLLLVVPQVLYAQHQDLNIERLANERQVIIQKIDSLEKRLNEIDALLNQISPEDRLAAMISKYGKNKGKMIASGKVWVSISFEMARDSWGEPSDIQKSVASSGHSEKWMYPDGNYLFFKNGRLESWKE